MGLAMVSSGDAASGELDAEGRDWLTHCAGRGRGSGAGLCGVMRGRVWVG